MAQRSHIQKEKDYPLDFSFIDTTINNAIIAGLTPSFGLYFFNKWMTSAELTGYDCECSKSAVSLSIEQAPQCYQMTVDSEAIYKQAILIATHLKDRVTWYDLDNEPGLDLYFHGLKDENPQQRIERWFRLIALPFIDGVRSVQPTAKFRTQLDLFCDYAYLLKVEQDLGEHCFDEIGVHPYADSLRTVVEKYNTEFSARLAPLLRGRPMPITEIQHVDNFRLMQMIQGDVIEHDPSRYITMHMVYPGILKAGLPGGPEIWALTKEGEALRTYLSLFRRRRSVQR